MAKVLIYCESTEAGKELLAAAKLIGDAQALVINDDAVAQDFSASGMDVLLFKDNAVIAADTAAIAQTILLAVQQCGTRVVLLSSDRRGKELAGRVAALIDAGCITDVKGITLVGDDIRCTCNSFGGATVATKTIITDAKVIAVSPASFAKEEAVGVGQVVMLSGSVQPSIKLLNSRPKEGDDVDLQAARIIVAVGQGVRERTEIDDINNFAETLGGVLACTKPIATDRKWLGEERIIGLSGVTCKPELAILIGISGQVQFTVGIRDAKTWNGRETVQSDNLWVLSSKLIDTSVS
jgi:electron transfer flavoprotein alpha subunit